MKGCNHNKYVKFIHLGLVQLPFKDTSSLGLVVTWQCMFRFINVLPSYCSIRY